MLRKSMCVLCLFALSLSARIATTLGDVSLTSAEVSYVASRDVSYTGGLGQISFDVAVTLLCKAAFNCSTDGILPPSSTCRLNVTPTFGNLTVVYGIERPIGADINGSQSILLSSTILQGLLGDSQPIEIPIDSVGAITIVIHGQLLGNVSVDTGSANPTSLEWFAWAPQDTVVSASVNTVALILETAYKVYFTVTVSIIGFDVASVDSTLTQVNGSPFPEFAIPEFPSITIPLLFLTATLLALMISRRRYILNK